MSKKVTFFQSISLLAQYFLVSIFLSPSHLNAQNYDEMSLDELLNIKIEVASSDSKTIFNAPSTVSVIDKNLIRQYNYNSVAEALIAVAGFEVMRTYLKRNLPTSRDILQPNYSNKTLVLINGIPQWNSVTGETSIDRININDVERIEVLKGPASVLYGTNAYSGAVNIILSQPGKESAAAHIAAGSHGLLQAGGSFTLKYDDWETFISAHTSDETGQDFLFRDENKVEGHVNEYLKGNTFTAFSKFRSHSLLLNTYITHESYLGNTPLFSSGAGKDHVSNGTLIAYNYERPITDKVNMKYGLVYDLNQRNFARSLDGLTKSNLKGYRVTNSLNVSYLFSDEFKIEAGADYDYRKSVEYKNYNALKDTLITNNNMEGKKTYEYSFIAQASYTKYALSLVAGTRFTRNELFGNNISSRATMVYVLNDRNSVKLIAGQSFRTPSLFELYFQPPTNTTFGNTALAPEKGNSIEAAYLTSFDNIFIQGLYYYSTYHNKIFRVKRLPAVPTDNSTVYANGNQFAAYGIEVELRYTNTEVADGFINYAYSKGNSGDEELSKNGNYNFKYIPAHTVSAGFSKRIFDFSASVLSNFRSKSYSLLGEVEQGLTFDFNLGFTHQFTGGSLNHSISVKNVFNHQMMFPEFTVRNVKEYPSGFGRRIYYEIHFSL